MTKTTNYKNSLRLKELGFKADFDYCYTIGDPEGVWNKTFELDCWGEYDEEQHCASYDLETLLVALPKNIRKKNNFIAKLKIAFDEKGDNVGNTSYIGYQDFEGYIPKFTKEQEVDESLADTACRLLVELIKEGIINLKEKNKC